MGCTDSYQLDTSEQMTISCHCGKVKLVCKEAAPRIQLECCCRSCTQRVEWCIANGSQGQMIGPTGPSFNCLVGNCFSEVQGKENLKLYKTRENTYATMYVAECCKACVAVLHEKQGGKIFICPADVCVITSTHKISHEETLVRMWTDEFEGELPPYTGRGEQIPKPASFKFMFSGLAPVVIKRTGMDPVKEQGDTNLQELALELGQPTIIGLDPMEHPKK